MRNPHMSRALCAIHTYRVSNRYVIYRMTSSEELRPRTTLRIIITHLQVSSIYGE